MPDPTPTLTDELAAVLDRHRLNTLGACGCGGWQLDTTGPLIPALAGHRMHVADILAPLVARMVADAEQRGRAEVSAAVESVLDERESLDREGRDAYVAPLLSNRVRAALADPAAAVARIKAEAGCKLQRTGDGTHGPLIRQAKAEALQEARDALYRGEGPDLVADSDVVYGEWLRNRADQIGGGA